MSENSNSANGNSWTILTPEVKESTVETVGAVSEGTEGHGHSTTPEAVAEEQTVSEGPHPETQAAEAAEAESSSQSQEEAELVPGTEHSKGDLEDPHSVDLPQVTPLESNEDSVSLSSTHPSVEAAPVNDVSGSSEGYTSSSPGPAEDGTSLSQLESSAPLNMDTDTFSDSYTHASPSSELTTELAAVPQEEEGATIDEFGKTETDVVSQPATDFVEEKGSEGDGLRRRNISLLGPLDHSKKVEEEEEDEDYKEEGEFRPPQREEESTFSLNKCILGAVILLGLGTIFFSGILVDLDEEGDIDMKDLRDTELQKNQEWMSSEVHVDLPAGLDSPETLAKLAKENQQITTLQAQLQEKTGALKVAQQQVEAGAKEQVQREELERENQRLKGELENLSRLQKELDKENERMKREHETAKKQIENLPALQNELDTLRAKFTELTRKAGDTPDSRDKQQRLLTKEEKKRLEKDKMGEVQKKREKEWKEGKEWSKDKSGKREEPLRGDAGEKIEWKDQKNMIKERKEWMDNGERKEWKEKKYLKKEKYHDDHGKERNGRGEKTDFKEHAERKEWIEKKKWKSDKRGEWDGAKDGKKERKYGKEWEGKKDYEGKDLKPKYERKEWREEKDFKRGKRDGLFGVDDRREKGDKKKEFKEQEWSGGKEWRKGKGERRHDGKEWQEKGEKEYRKDKEKYWKGAEKKKPWPGKEQEMSHSGELKTDERKQGKKEKSNYYKDGVKEEKIKHEEKDWLKKEKHLHDASKRMSHGHNKHKNDHIHDNYWTEQRERLQQYREVGGCSGVANCAKAEGLVSVPLPEFEALLQGYLSRLPATVDQTTKKEELSKLVKEFFMDGFFVHDQMPFSGFVEDVADILEDMVEGEESEEQEDEMEEFEREAMEKFALPEQRKRGEGKTESSRVKG